MKFPTFFDSKNSKNLFGLKENFDFLNFYLKKNYQTFYCYPEKRV